MDDTPDNARLIAAVISYNNEYEIWHMLNSIAKLDGIFIVDGHSRDNTVNLVRNWATRNNKDVHLSQHEWHDDFARQRNVCLNNIKRSLVAEFGKIPRNTWILSIDCDDMLCGFDRQAVMDILSNSPVANRCEMLMTYDSFTKSRHTEIRDFFGIRVFRLNEHSTWRNAVHEYIDVQGRCGDLDDQGDLTDIIRLNPAVVSQRVGHAVQHCNDPGRNIRIGKRLVSEQPNNIRAKFFLARDLMFDTRIEPKERFTEALSHIRDYIRLAPLSKRNIRRDRYVVEITAKMLAHLYGVEVAKRRLLSWHNHDHNVKRISQCLSELSVGEEAGHWLELSRSGSESAF